jgi:hypothetical protein
MKRVLIVCAMLLAAAYPVSADPIVTWQGSGAVTSSDDLFPGFPDHPFYRAAPPVGTPLSFNVSFDPSQAHPTMFSSPGSGCLTVPASGSLTIGDYTYGLNGEGLTHGLAPGITCATGSLSYTEFGLHVSDVETGAPWELNNGRGMLIVYFNDPLIRDTFPTSPAASSAGLYWAIFPGSPQAPTFEGRIDLSAVDEMTPVPEPGTLSLLALGLAAAYRKRRAS